MGPPAASYVPTVRSPIGEHSTGSGFARELLSGTSVAASSINWLATQSFPPISFPLPIPLSPEAINSLDSHSSNAFVSGTPDLRDTGDGRVARPPFKSRGGQATQRP